VLEAAGAGWSLWTVTKPPMAPKISARSRAGSHRPCQDGRRHPSPRHTNYQRECCAERSPKRLTRCRPHLITTGGANRRTSRSWEATSSARRSPMPPGVRPGRRTGRR